MEKKYVKKLAEIVEKLRTADDREAHRILDRLQYGSFLHKAAVSLVKKDFSLDKEEAIVLLAHALPNDRSGLNVDHRHGFYYGWYNSKVANQTEKISIAIDCTNLKKVVMLIAHTEQKRTNMLNFSDCATTRPQNLRPSLTALKVFPRKSLDFGFGRWEK